jgi:DNA-binding phage protein
MPLTRSFNETVKEQLADSEARREFLREAVNDLVAGNLDAAKILLREYINATVGFVALGHALGKSPKSLMRMLSAEGNPHARNVCEIMAYLQKSEGLALTVASVAA